MILSLTSGDDVETSDDNLRRLGTQAVGRLAEREGERTSWNGASSLQVFGYIGVCICQNSLEHLRFINGM